MDATFPNGNADSWNHSISNYLPAAIAVIMKTTDPVICAALLALTGSSDDFERDAGVYQFAFDKEGLPFSLQATLTYNVPSFKVAQATQEAVAKDRAFILSYLQQVQGIKLQTVELCTKKGMLTVALTVKVGYSND